jgi:hypothetical protein
MTELNFILCVRIMWTFLMCIDRTFLRMLIKISTEKATALKSQYCQKLTNFKTMHENPPFFWWCCLNIFLFQLDGSCVSFIQWTIAYNRMHSLPKIGLKCFRIASMTTKWFSNRSSHRTSLLNCPVWSDLLLIKYKHLCLTKRSQNLDVTRTYG